MSEYITGYVTKLTNKIKYRLYKTANEIVADPEAESYAAEQQKLKEEEKKKDGYTDTAPNAPNAEDSDTMKTIKMIWEYVVKILKSVFIPILCLILSSYVANEMIMYPVPIRVIFFVFTLILCATYDVVFGSILFLYIAKRLYQYYLDNYANLEEKQYIIPYRFSFLPVIYTKEKVGFFKGFFSYPQDNTKADTRLTMIMDEYKQSLDASFPFLESVKGDDIFSKGLEKFDKAFKDIHKELPKEPSEEEKEKKEEESKEKEPKVEESKEKNKPIVTNTALDKQVNEAVKIAANKITPINSSVLVPTTPVNNSVNKEKKNTQVPATSQGPVFYQPPEQQQPQQQQGPVFYTPPA